MQTISASDVDGVPGGVTQVKEVSAALIRMAKLRNITLVIVGHVTKDGTIAGPRVLEHLVDVVLHFEGERTSRLRMVRAVKNRYGPVDEVGCFDLSAEGIVAITDPTGLFLDALRRSGPRHLRRGRPGGAAAAAQRGAGAGRPHTPAERPRRTTSGVDSARVAMILAVLQQHAGVRLHNHDVFVSSVGGARLTEPSNDVAIALAITSAWLGKPLGRNVVAIGELGLSGELRRVRDVGVRLAEAGRMGFRSALVPARPRRPPGNSRVLDGMRVVDVDNIARALTLLGLEKSDNQQTITCPRLPTWLPQNVSTTRPACGRPWRGIAPGTSLRDGLERILRGRTGALIVVGNDKVVEGILTGGFTLDVPFSATALRELAKMDGAIVLDRDIARIYRANVHLMPDHTIPSEETGTRHRTADRVAKQTGAPVISVSQSMHIIAVYVGAIRYVLEDSGQILARANQALATLERYKVRLDEVSSTLSALEIEDLVTVRDVAVVAQRLEMVSRIAREIDDYVNELGTDGRLLSLQLEELVTGVEAERELVVRDYQAGGRPYEAARGGPRRARGPLPAELVDIACVAQALGLGQGEHLDGAVTPRGHRLLAKVPRLPTTVVDRLVEHFETLQKLLSASVEDLQTVDGVGELRARSVREGLSRLAESSILERYV